MKPNKNETEAAFMKRCASEKPKGECSRLWKQRGKNMNISMREFKRAPDLAKIRSVAGNPDLAESDVCDFGTFLICRSGTFNETTITNDAQKQAVKQWIGKQILYHDHLTQVSNQIGRIYDSWIVEHGGEVETYGRGFGVRTHDLSDAFKRIENGIHREMSMGINLTDDGSWEPHHLSFVSDPAIRTENGKLGAGLLAGFSKRIVSALGTDYDDSTALQKIAALAEDGVDFRAWAADEFRRWYQRSNPQTTTDETAALAEKLSAREMVTLARIEQRRFSEAIPDGSQVLTVNDPEGGAAPVAPAEPLPIRELSRAFSQRSK